ncbi:MAG: hypothetical protein K2M60_11910, partial [Lachnospiraceae bacterium]|nr:hypothetical protein [Lachnospiraceae bacterium]
LVGLEMCLRERNCSRLTCTIYILPPYRNVKHSEQDGEIKIKSHAAVVAWKLYPDKKPKQQER